MNMWSINTFLLQFRIPQLGSYDINIDVDYQYHAFTYKTNSTLVYTNFDMVLYASYIIQVFIMKISQILILVSTCV